MEGLVKHYIGEQDGWEDLFLECTEQGIAGYEVEDGEASIPFEFEVSRSNEIATPTGVSMGLGHKQTPKSTPTKFTFCVTVNGSEELYFAVEDRKTLLTWFRAIREVCKEPARILTPPTTPTAKKVEEAKQAQEEVEQQQKDEEKPEAAKPVAKEPPREPTIKPIVQTEQEHDKENASGNQTGDKAVATIVVNFEDLELFISFRNDHELAQVTVFDLKATICSKVNAEDDRFIHPGQLDLRIGDAVLREYWKGTDFGLYDGTVIDASVRKANGSSSVSSSHSNVEPVAAKPKVILSMNLKVGAETIPLEILENDKPEDVARDVVEKHNLSGDSHHLAISCEIYKCLATKLKHDNQSLRNHIYELKQATRDKQPALKEQTKDYYETLLEKASSKIEQLEEEKRSMSDQLFELRLVNAERLSGVM